MTQSINRRIAGNFKQTGLPASVEGATGGGFDSAEVNDIVINSEYLNSENLIINGAMQIAQRGALSVNEAASVVHNPDRFAFNTVGAAVVTNSSDSATSLSDTGFKSAMKVDVTTADASLAGTDFGIIRYVFEGRDVQSLKYGTSDAKDVTISFWVRSPKTGTHIVELYHNSAAYGNSRAYTVSSANTWEFKSLTFSGYTATALPNEDEAELRIFWWLASGSTYAGGTLNDNTWNNTAANRAAGQVNCLDNTSNNFYLTGVKMEVGSRPTPFRHRTEAEELARCQRYYQRYDRFSNYAGLNLMVPFSGTGANCPMFLAVQPRTNPSVTYSDASHFDYFGITGTGASGNPSSLQSHGWGGGNSMELGITSTSLTTARGYLFEPNNSAGCWFAFDAEVD